MTEPYLGQIRLFATPIVPRGWVPCDGTTFQVNQFPDLFAVLGNAFGGDGVQTFALPDLRGRLPVHVGDGIGHAEAGGLPEAWVTTAALPRHNHPALASNLLATDGVVPGQTVMLAVSNEAPLYTPGAASPIVMSPSMVTESGGSEAHENRMPYLVMRFCISVQGSPASTQTR
jgi:microcystin-dependent protein